MRRIIFGNDGLLKDIIRIVMKNSKMYILMKNSKIKSVFIHYSLTVEITLREL